MSRLASLLFGALLLAAPALAQDPTVLPPPDKAPVVLDGRQLFAVGEAGAWSAKQRAVEVNRILRAAAADPEPVNLTLAAHDGYPTIRMGDWHLLTVMDSDAVPGMDSGEQAERWLQIVEAALLEARTERTAAYLVVATLRVLAALVAAVVLQWLLGRLRRRVPLALGRRGLQMHSPLGGKPGWHLGIDVVCVVLQAIAWVAALLYAVEQFPPTRQVRYQVAGVVGDSLGAPLFTVNQRAYSANDLFWLIGAAGLLWLVVSLVTRLLSVRLMRATGASRGALQPVAIVVRYGLTFVGLIVIFQLAGLNLSSLAILASVLGVGIGFGLQSIANNFVSGIILSFEQPIKPGDFVSVGSLQGTVLRIGGRSTIIRTLDRVSIIVPNARLLEEQVVNWSHGDELVRLHVPVGVAYGSDIEQVRGALLDAAKAQAAVLADPRPSVRFVGFGDNALNLELLVWTNNPSGHVQLESDLCYQVAANLRGAGIEIPFPQRTLTVSPAAVDAIADRLHGTRDRRASIELYDSSGAPAQLHPDPARPLPVGDGGSHVRPPTDGVDLERLLSRMRGRDGVAIQDRRHLLSVYRKCFVGSEAVEWLMREQQLTRDEAVRTGQTLVERRIIHHVLDEHPFRDGHFFYRFYADELERADGEPAATS